MSTTNSRIEQRQQKPWTGKGLICALILPVLSGCAGQPQRSTADQPDQMLVESLEQSTTQASETSYPEYVFRRQNDVIDRSMFLVDENPQISDEIYQNIQLREESLYEACSYLNEMARIRSQQEEESWYLLVQTLFSLGQCEAAANELDNYLLNIQSEDSDKALGAL